MKLPNAENAYIDPRKLKDYLLSETHRHGKHKARFFRLMGFQDDNVELLGMALLNLARCDEVTKTVPSPRGTKYVIVGPAKTPSGLTVLLRTVWIILEGEDQPRFVTAYPI